VLGDLPLSSDPRVLVDYRTSDDAGVYLIDQDRALVQTVDFFTPIVDDPFLYGQIAAANALSDVYAMGGRPLTALAIAGFSKEADPGALREIFLGGLDKLREAGVALLGGHTVQDAEIKFGYAITGEVHPARIWSNAGAKAGDALLLTKGIGTGIVSTALKFDRAPAAAIAAAAASMQTLNRKASDALRRLPDGAVHACTDVTGFGLIGHAVEMAAASGCTVMLRTLDVPVLEGARELAARNAPGGTKANLAHFGPHATIDALVPSDFVSVLYDPQTSGGLLVAVDPAHVDQAMSVLGQSGSRSAIVGHCTANTGCHVVVEWHEPRTSA
jgi:selenide, water dikinase